MAGRNGVEILGLIDLRTFQPVGDDTRQNRHHDGLAGRARRRPPANAATRHRDKTARSAK